MRWLTGAGTWGSSADERAADYPCDELVPRPDVVAWRALDVDAPAPLVFRWLCQLRIAPYSYDWLDNFGRQSPRRLSPGLEQLEVGQRFMTVFRLVSFADGSELTIEAPRTVMGQVACSYRVTGAEPDRSRVVAKLVVRAPRGPLRAAVRTLLPIGDLVMMRKQLRTLKALAERDAREPTAPV